MCTAKRNLTHTCKKNPHTWWNTILGRVNDITNHHWSFCGNCEFHRNRSQGTAAATGDESNQIAAFLQSGCATTLGNRKVAWSNRMTCSSLNSHRAMPTITLITMAKRRMQCPGKRYMWCLFVLKYWSEFFRGGHYSRPTRNIPIGRITKGISTDVTCFVRSGLGFVFTFNTSRQRQEERRTHNTKLHSEGRRWKDRPDFFVIESGEHKSFEAFVYVGPVFHSPTPKCPL